VFIVQFGGAQPTNAPRGDESSLNFPYAVIIEILIEK